jgi:hypothetical protein
VVEITQELHELCGDSSVVHELLELGGGEVMPISIKKVRHVVPFGVRVAKSGLLATVLVRVFAREVCDFVATLTATYPGSALD